MGATFSKGVYIPELLFLAFQATFAAITCLPDRRRLRRAHEVRRRARFMVLWFTFSYAPIAHMVWFWMGPDAYTTAEVARR
jgi:Amt family ammonium transporter